MFGLTSLTIIPKITTSVIQVFMFIAFLFRYQANVQIFVEIKKDLIPNLTEDYCVTIHCLFQIVSRVSNTKEAQENESDQLTTFKED